MNAPKGLRRDGAIRSPWPVILVIGVAFVGLTGCASDPTTSNEYQQLEQQLATVTAERDDLAAGQLPSVELPAAAAEALQHYSDAVLAANGDEMLRYVTPGFTFESYGEPLTTETYADTINRYYADFKVEELGDWLVLGDGSSYVVAQPERATAPAWKRGFSVLRLVQRDGAWLVDTHRFTGE